MPQELPMLQPSRPITDMLGRAMLVPVIPGRIISLVPSQTELLIDLGLDEKVVGITKFCIHPREQAIAKAKVGGTKSFNFNLIKRLKPDLIIGNKEENYKAGIDLLASEFPVWMSDVTDLESALLMITAVGDLTGAETKAAEIITGIKREFAKLKPVINQTVAYFIWRKPYMAAGKGTFIEDMLNRMGLKNVFADADSRYPEISTEELKKANPGVILLSSEPYPFKANHIQELQAIMPDSRIHLVDGELFSWYGSRLLKTPEYLREVQQLII